MLIDFDSAKDEINRGKHGLTLALAKELDWDNALVWVDDRQDYGELRMIALAPATGVLYARSVRGPQQRPTSHQPSSSEPT